jgi:hypothetical protein
MKITRLATFPAQMPINLPRVARGGRGYRTKTIIIECTIVVHRRLGPGLLEVRQTPGAPVWRTSLSK